MFQESMAELNYSRHAFTITFSWSPWRDTKGLRGYEWGLGRDPRRPPDVVTWTSVSNTTTFVENVSVPGAYGALQDGLRYYCMVQAVNRAGIRRYVVSDGYIVDASPPLPFPVFDVGEAVCHPLHCATRHIDVTHWTAALHGRHTLPTLLHLRWGGALPSRPLEFFRFLGEQHSSGYDELIRAHTETSVGRAHVFLFAVSRVKKIVSRILFSPYATCIIHWFPIRDLQQQKRARDLQRKKKAHPIYAKPAHRMGGSCTKSRTPP